MNRRAFISNIGKTAVVLGLSSMVGCSFSNVYANILKYIPVGLSAFNAIVAILSGAGIIPPGGSVVIAVAINLVKAAFADLQTAITQWQNAPAASKAGLLGAITTALTIVEADLQNFWASLNIPDGTLASLIEGLLGVIVSTLMAFSSQLPPATPSPALTAALEKRKSLRRTITVTPKMRTVKEFKVEFNAKLNEAGYTQNAIY